MKKYLILTVALPLAFSPIVHGAASSGQTPLERYKNALPIGVLVAVDAYAELTRSEQQQELPSLARKLIAQDLSSNEREQIAIVLQSIKPRLNAFNTIMRWLINRDVSQEDALKQQVINLYSSEAESSSKRLQAILTAGDAARQAREEYFAAPSRVKSLRELTVESTAKKLIDRLYNFSKDFLTIEDLAMRHLIKTMYMTGSFKDKIPKELQSDIYEVVIAQLAHDEFLRLLASKNPIDFGLIRRGPLIRPVYNTLHPLLKEYFKGISIQDIINYGLYPQKLDSAGVFSLSYKFINSLNGIENIPNIGNASNLGLENNRLTSIEPGVFNTLGEGKLVSISLKHNQLTSIEPGAFNGLATLKILNLNHSQLKSIQPGAFNDLSNLTDLYLRKNQLTTIKSKSFNGLTNLETLYLSNNPLITIEPGAFDDLINLEELYIQGIDPAVQDEIVRQIQQVAPGVRIYR